MRFNTQDQEALRILGFTVATTRDGEVAFLEGEMRISIIRGAGRLSMAITLPGGGEIAAIIPPQYCSKRPSLISGHCRPRTAPAPAQPSATLPQGAAPAPASAAAQRWASSNCKSPVLRSPMGAWTLPRRARSSSAAASGAARDNGASAARRATWRRRWSGWKSASRDMAASRTCGAHIPAEAASVFCEHAHG